MSNKEAIKKLLKILFVYKKDIFIVMTCLIVSTLLKLCIPQLSKQIMDKGFISGNKQILFKLVILTSFIYLIEVILSILKEKKRINIEANIQYFLNEQSFLHLIKMKANYYNNTNNAEILNNISVDIRNMLSIANDGMFYIITQGFNMIGGFIGLYIINSKLTLIVLFFIPAKYVAMKYFAKRRKELMDEYIECNRDYACWFGDTFGGIREIKLFGIYENKIGEFKKKQNNIIRNQKNLNMISQLNMSVDFILVQILIMTVYIIGANLVFNMDLSIGSIFAFVTYSSYVVNPISSILNIGYIFSGILPSTKRYYEFLSQEEEVNCLLLSSKPAYGDLKLYNVCFGYENKETILDDINIEIEKGEKIAIVGRNGSGKSTIIDLITRMYNPIKGQIFLNNIDISEFDIYEYRKIFSIVNQKIYLFNDTIRNNICLYKNICDEKIMEAIKDSGLNDYIEKVSLDYIVGDNGATLSGGQKQKIALARALVNNSDIVILDEATSNTDIYSEYQINSLLDTKLKNKTVIIASHRKEILNKVNKIVFVKNGKAESFGNYEYLFNSNLDFQEMIQLG